LSISLLNIDRFSQFFHRRTQLELCNKIINKDPTSPQMCCYRRHSQNRSMTPITSRNSSNGHNDILFLTHGVCTAPN